MSINYEKLLTNLFVVKNQEYFIIINVRFQMNYDLGYIWDALDRVKNQFPNSDSGIKTIVRRILCINI